MKALIVLDFQNGMQNAGDFIGQKENILKLSRKIKQNNGIIVATKHIDKNPNSIIFSDSDKGNVDEDILNIADFVIEKTTPNIFKGTDLAGLLEKNKIDEVIITGFNAEYCCLFSAIICSDRGYIVSYIEDATASVNDANTYEMPGLDIPDFVGCILDWSGIINVYYLDEYLLNNLL